MHCTMDDLVALRDGEGSVWARQHVNHCATCQAELDALFQRIAQLKALPALRPPRDRWSQVRDEIVGARHRRRRAWGGWSLAAAAAVAGVVVLGPWGQGSTLHAELTQAKQQSASLESTLQQVEPEGRVMSGREAALAAQLEDEIAALDAQLITPRQEAQEVNLWRQRVDLMQRLVQVRVTRASYVGL